MADLNQANCSGPTTPTTRGSQGASGLPPVSAWDGPAQAGMLAREALLSRNGRGVLDASAGRLTEAPQAPRTARAAVLAAPAARSALVPALEALGARLATGAGIGLGAAAGAVAFAVVPMQRTPDREIALCPNLRVRLLYDEVIGQVEAKIDGRWTPTGVEAYMAVGGLAMDLDALEACIGPLDESILNNPGIINERTSKIDSRLSANSETARRAVAASMRPGTWQAHHLIPFETMALMSPSLQQAVAQAGWTMNSAENVMALPADEATYASMSGRLPIHRGPHPAYSKDVKVLLQSLETAHATLTVRELRIALAGIETEMRARLNSKRYHVFVR